MLLFHHGGDNMGRLANLSSGSGVDACSMGCDLFSTGTVGLCVSASFLTSVLQSWQRGVWDRSCYEPKYVTKRGHHARESDSGALRSTVGSRTRLQLHEFGELRLPALLACPLFQIRSLSRGLRELRARALKRC